MPLPKVITFEGLGRFTFTMTGKRAPRKGEFFLSGAIPMAYKATNDLSTPYVIVVPVAAMPSIGVGYGN